MKTLDEKNQEQTCTRAWEKNQRRAGEAPVKGGAEFAEKIMVSLSLWGAGPPRLCGHSVSQRSARFERLCDEKTKSKPVRELGRRISAVRVR